MVLTSLPLQRYRNSRPVESPALMKQPFLDRTVAVRAVTYGWMYVKIIVSLKEVLKNIRIESITSYLCGGGNVAVTSSRGIEN